MTAEAPVPLRRLEEPSTLRKLAQLSLAYATGDVLAQAINFLLIPLYVAYLDPEDYGALALLFLLSTFLKPIVRLGLDSGFIRIYYDVKEEDRRRFAFTAAFFAALAASAVFAVGWIFSRELSIALFENPNGVLWVRLVLVDLLASSFVFVPFALLRIEGSAALLSTFSLIRNGANTVIKVIMVLSGMRVTGVLISDAAASLLLAILLLVEMKNRAQVGFHWAPLREALRFGLPKVPHGILVQTLNLADRRILEAFVSLGEVGVYAVGNNFAGAMKFPLSAFEPAWQPFVFENAKKENGPRDIALLGTRVAVFFVVIALGLSLILPDLLIFMARKVAYHAAAPIIPVIVLAFLFHGFFLLSSIGISIAKEARYYPLITAAAAGVNITLNFALIPLYGIMGSAWATVAGYALMALLGATISNRLYPLPLGWPRITAALVAAISVFVGASFLGQGAGPLVVRVTMAGVFALGVWRWIYDARDRAEFRKVIGV